MRIFSFRNLRVLILLAILALVANYVKDQKLVTQGWYQPLEIVVYPINPANSPNVQQYIDSLTSQDFSRIDQFIKRESEKYDVISGQPTITRLGQTLEKIPPQPPQTKGSILKAILWSLQLRYWIWQHAPDEENDKYLVRMFVLYHDLSNQRLQHSVGLQKGLVGIVNAYGATSQTRQNNIVIAHEFFHTVGASDKYDEYGHPIPPDGLGDPNKSPVYPQRKAEIMAGRRAISPHESEMPRGFKSIVLGRKTAQEIGWIDNL